ncbi:MAG TPA: GntR family transcriptional regulator, partial [bacterium]|nr:GntR family transcriptional regulator [bacterium]
MKPQTKKLMSRVHRLLLRSHQPLTENVLASRFKVSLTPVREVIKHLEMEGILVSGRNRGITFRPWQLEELRHVYEIRALLESYATSQASRHLTEKDLKTLSRLSRLYHQARQHQRGHQAFVLDQRFHEKILAASKNTYLVSVMEKVRLIYSSMYLRN